MASLTGIDWGAIAAGSGIMRAKVTAPEIVSTPAPAPPASAAAKAAPPELTFWGWLRSLFGR